MDRLPKTNEEWRAWDREYRIQSALNASPMVLERGEGIYLWDVEGNRFMDFQAGQLCVSAGHAHPKYAEALYAQAKQLIQTGSSFTVPSQILLAKKIAELAGPPLKKSYFGCTGSESNEGALRLAKHYTGRHEVVSLMQAYHGRTYASYSVTGYGRWFRKGYGPAMPGVIFIPPATCYRCAFNETYPGCGLSCFRFAREIVDRTSSGEPAAVLLELIMSAAGVIVPPKEWVQELVAFRKERGALLIVDEALTGMGRTGKWFAFQHYDFVPDIVTMSKGLGGGVPICAVTTTAEIADAAVRNGFVQSSSHTGDPLLCSTALANIAILEEESLVNNAAVVGAQMKEALTSLQDECDILGDVRGLGLCLGLEIVRGGGDRSPWIEGAQAITRHCRQAGLWLALEYGATGFSPNCLRIMPPLSITKDEAEVGLTILGQAIRAAQKLGR